jgi:hypothetical protein
MDVKSPDVGQQGNRIIVGCIRRASAASMRGCQPCIQHRCPTSHETPTLGGDCWPINGNTRHWCYFIWYAPVDNATCTQEAISLLGQVRKFRTCLLLFVAP